MVSNTPGAPDPGAGSGPAWYAPKRWLYRGGRPHGLAKAMNDFSSWLYSHGWFTLGVGGTLVVTGRQSGRPVSLPVVVLTHEGARYLVSMLGENANWVRNVRAAGGDATLVFDGQHEVTLVEVPVPERAPLLRAYLAVAPGARPHIPVSRTAPPSAFEPIAADYPVFRIDPRR